MARNRRHGRCHVELFPKHRSHQQQAQLCEVQIAQSFMSGSFHGWSDTHAQYLHHQGDIPTCKDLLSPAPHTRFLLGSRTSRKKKVTASCPTRLETSVSYNLGQSSRPSGVRQVNIARSFALQQEPACPRIALLSNMLPQMATSGGSWQKLKIACPSE